MSATVVKGYDYTRNKIHPKKFALWVACASIAMMFTAFTSAYLVRQAQGNWLEFPFPPIFYGSTVVILLSSIMLHFAYVFFKRGNALLYKSLLAAAFILGIAFLIFQYQGWQALYKAGLPLGTNPSGDFIYAISGVHAAHIVGGIAALIVAVIHAFALKYQVTPARKLRFELTLTYWHFVDFLWIYLFLFFIMQS